jgi:cellobiose epimerase
VNGQERRALADDVEAALRRHVLSTWFPRSVDRERGGFLQRFDRRWRPTPNGDWMLEFQARQTRSAARLAIAFPSDPTFAEAAIHGVRHLREVMWDRDHGGWYWLVGASRAPLADGLKHAHATSYALGAAALAYRATGDAGARELADEAFAWFDERGHDAEHGGYHGWLTRDGHPVLSAADVPAGRLDPLEHAPGLKDINVHGDWLEALGEYVEASGHTIAAERSAELAALFISKISNAAGEMHYAFHRDWSPQPGLERYGYIFSTATRLSAMPTLHGAMERARALLDHALASAASPRGGYIFAGAAGPPYAAHGESMRIRARAWWVQLEALRALTVFACAGEATQFEEPLQRQWAFIRREHLDEAWGGVYERAVGDLAIRHRPLSRYRNAGWLRKAWAWKDASHETDTFLAVIRALRGTGDGPL